PHRGGARPPRRPGGGRSRRRRRRRRRRDRLARGGSRSAPRGGPGLGPAWYRRVGRGEGVALRWTLVPDRPTSRLAPLWWVTGPLLVALLASVIWVAARPVPYYTMSPGKARSVEPLVTITSDDEGVAMHEE